MSNTPEEQTPPKKVKPFKLRFPAIHLLLRIVTLVLTALLVLGAVTLVVYRDELNIDALQRYLSYLYTDTGEDGAPIPFVHAGGDDMNFCRLGSGVVLASQSGAHYYSSTGESYAQQVGGMNVPVLERSDSVAVAYDAGGQSLHLFTKNENPFSLTLEDTEELLSARPNDEGWLAVTAQKSGYKGSVTIYNNRFAPVMEINLSSAFVVDAALSPDCKTVAVVTIGQVDGVFQSNLLLYPIDGKDPTATLSLEGTVVLDMEFEPNTLWILSDRSLLTFTPEGTAVSSYPYDPNHLKGHNFGGDGFAALLLSEYEAGDPNQLVTVDGSGTTLGRYSLLGEVPDLDCNGQYLSVLSSSGLSVLNPDLSEYATLEDTQGAQALAQSADGSVLLAGAQEAFIYLPAS